MTLDQIRFAALNLPHTTEGFPFNETTLVFKVGGKMFLLVDIVDSDKITLKSDPQKQALLVEENEWITPGFHMNKTHWITLDVKHLQANPAAVLSLIEQSYMNVINGLPKKTRASLEN